MEEAAEYLANEELLPYLIEIVDSHSTQNERAKPENTTPYPPQLDDLARLHKLVRSRKVTTIMEFGVGYSNLVLADALYKNSIDFKDDILKLDLRRNNLFELHCIEVSQHWIEISKNRIPQHLRGIITYHQSNVEITTHQGRICHRYNKLPNICPDFVYLDAPHPFDVEGEKNGISFRHNDRVVLSSDLISIEYLLLPGTLIVIDGRTTNARFLKDFLKRPWQYTYNEKGDVHLLELKEKPLGEINKRQIKFCLGND
ncbi:hypothetical protein [Kiloniella sp. EL199]|uniref:hypothetical protein n=1 Tax=Kiloniella sp. EL199 TaxID=2107581 RepID=UPI000EA36122|nr:hypothetical protein [Kiloniella sp. EL199]